MKRLTLCTMISVGILISSCHKDTASANTSNGGSWTIKGTTYNADSCTAPAPIAGMPDAMEAQTVLNLNTYSQITIFLGLPPTANSTYTLVNDSVFVNGVFGSNQAYLDVTIGGLVSGTEYQATGTGSFSVTVSPTGKIGASSTTGIEVQNINPPYDSTKLYFNLIQTN